VRKIGQDDIDLLAGQALERPLDGGDAGGRVAGVLEEKRGEDPARKIVIDDEDSCMFRWTGRV